MPWSQKILTQFELVPHNPTENEYHGPYNKLLNSLFPPDSDFTVTPQYLRVGSNQAVDFLVTYEVLLKNMPVFVLELKSPRELVYISSRHDADEQMRRRLADLRDTCPIQTLHGVCAMGTRLCFYHVPSGNDGNAMIQPPLIPCNPMYVTDTAPADRWNCDILDPDGESRFRSVIEEIYQACGSLLDI